MDYNPLTIKKISLLYELSLAVGSSLELLENISHFLNILIIRKKLSYASVWLSETQRSCTASDDNYELIVGIPGFRINLTRCEEDIPIIEYLKTNPVISLTAKDEGFTFLVQEKDIKEGAYAIFNLGGFGFLKLYTTNNEEVFSKKELAEFMSVIDKFTNSILACLTFQKLNKETNHRIEAQNALKAGKEEYQMLIQNLFEGIIITDLEGVITYLNDQMAELVGYSKEEIIGQKAHKLLIGEDNQGAFKQGFIKRKTERPTQYEIEHRHKNGTRWWGKIKVSPYRNLKGKIIGTIGAISDITHQKKLEEQKNTLQEKASLTIKNNENKLRQIIDTSLDAIINIDQRGNVTEWNKCAETIFGFSRAEAIGQNMGKLIIPHRHREAHKKGMAHFMKTGHGPVLNQRIEITALNKDKREFPIELSISPIKIKGEYIFSGFIRDITERKQAKDDLIQAKKEADHARMAEQQFLANMSHEIRTPMNAVIGMTYLLYKTSPSAIQLEYLDTLKFSADSLMGIINNILDLSKIEAGELELEPRPFNLKELILSLRQTFEFKLHNKPINVVADVDAKIKNHLIGDDTRLNQILTNLLGNASKFTKEGTIGIKVSLVTKQGDTCWVEFNVHDTGVGINAEKVPLIFENFKQIEPEVNRKFGGTGLGLSIVKQLVSLQNGTIEVKSVLAKGSEFIIVLPFKDSDIPITEVLYPIIKSEDHQDILTKIIILVVEDNLMNQRLITKILDMWKCPFDLVDDGQEAFEKSKSKKYDIILMDIHMPIMDGIESARLIRSDTTNPNHQTPIIALTAAALLDERNRVFEVGMNDFLTKPFSPSTLESTIIKWLGFQPILASPKSIELNQKAVSINLDYLREFSQNDIGFIQEMIHMFLDAMPSSILELKKYRAEKNWDMLYKTAHKMKPNFMMMGMKHQEKAAESVELLASKKVIDTQKIIEIIGRLEKDAEMAYPLLKDLSEQLK